MVRVEGEGGGNIGNVLAGYLTNCYKLRRAFSRGWRICGLPPFSLVYFGRGGFLVSSGPRWPHVVPICPPKPPLAGRTDVDKSCRIRVLVLHRRRLNRKKGMNSRQGGNDLFLEDRGRKLEEMVVNEMGCWVGFDWTFTLVYPIGLFWGMFVYFENRRRILRSEGITNSFSFL